MYAGHLAISLAVQSRSPNIPAWVFAVGGMLLDIIGGFNFALGFSRAIPDPTAGTVGFDFVDIDWDHSLLMASVWSSLYAVAAWAFIRTRGGSTSEVAKYAYAMGMTHWILDAVVHNPDLALYPGSPYKFGTSLWSLTPWGSWLLETYFCGLMAVIYFRNYSALGLSSSKIHGPLYLIGVAQLTMLPNISLATFLSSRAPADGIITTKVRIASGLMLALVASLGPALFLAKELDKVKATLVKTEKKE